MYTAIKLKGYVPSKLLDAWRVTNLAIISYRDLIEMPALLRDGIEIISEARDKITE